ncbi:MAG: TonB-dependent receptor [Pigmentiphaga sp.]|uniref:TonB-dependent receptor domain-containing protein n=1 Tax=Pigmentiphaga sp. TaxID=1977564 RepID=UPI00299FB922|nr:TonB-dependent receptor [Pigmentiphaga sp.]MDX3905269.1 TonB-dependent receptor [Pigmentiphaga sp.]
MVLEFLHHLSESGRQRVGRRAALLAALLAAGGCAPTVSLHEPPSASTVPPGPPAAQVRAPEPELPYTSVAITYPVRDAGAVAAPATPGWNPSADLPVDGRTGAQAYGMPGPKRQSNYEFEQKLDDTWVVRQSVRYGRPENQPETDWVTGATASGQDPLAPGLGTFNVGTQAQAKFTTLGLQHSFKFGFDYLKSRDLYESRIAPSPSLDIFDAAYGTTIGQPRIVARSFSEQSKLGFFMQDQVQYQKWTLSMVGRRDQNTHRTIDLNTTDSGEGIQQDDVYSARVGLRYQFDSGLAPYLNYSQSYAPVAGDATSATSRQYETGVRYQPPALGPLMTITAFNQVQNNTQTSNVQEGCVLAGCRAWADLRISGATVESRMQPLQGLNLVASYALTNSIVLAASDDAYGTMLGNRYPEVSEQRISLGAQYAFTRGSFAGLSLDGRVGRTGAVYGSAAESGMSVSYTLLDAGINYDFAHLSPSLKGLRLRASANNMFDYAYASYCYTDACTPGAGRSVSAVLNYQVPWP